MVCRKGSDISMNRLKEYRDDDEAVAEAKRLCLAGHGVFLVLEVVARIEPASPPVKVTRL